MRAFLQGLCGQRLVVQARQHHQGDAGRGGVGAPYRSSPCASGKPRSSRMMSTACSAKMLLGLAHAIHMGQFGVVRALLVEHLAEQTGVSWVVLDQEKHL